MRGKEPSRRTNLLWLALPILSFALFALASRTPYFLAVRLALAAVLVALAAADWRVRGHPWFPTLSWAVPVGALWLAAQAIFERPRLAVALTFWAGCAILLVMLASTGAAHWWYETVLRRRFKT